MAYLNFVSFSSAFVMMVVSRNSFYSVSRRFPGVGSLGLTTVLLYWIMTQFEEPVVFCRQTAAGMCISPLHVCVCILTRASASLFDRFF